MGTRLRGAASRLLALVIPFLVAIGCSSVSSRSVYLRLTDNRAGELELGSTTEEDVQELFGDPDVIQVSDAGSRVLIYNRSVRNKTDYDLFPGSKLYDYSSETSRSAYLEVTFVDGRATNYVFVETLSD
ncbi:MAG: hypothetical protein AB1486_19990 [Planctomycetota bacterium]